MRCALPRPQRSPGWTGRRCGSRSTPTRGSASACRRESLPSAHRLKRWTRRPPGPGVSRPAWTPRQTRPGSRWSRRTGRTRTGSGTCSSSARPGAPTWRCSPRRRPGSATTTRPSGRWSGLNWPRSWRCGSGSCSTPWTACDPLHTCPRHRGRRAGLRRTRAAGASPRRRVGGARGRGDRRRRAPARLGTRRPMARRHVPPDLRHRGPVGLLPRGDRAVLRGRARPAPSRAPAAEPLRLHHLSGELTMLGSNQYGKAETRLVLVRRSAPEHEVVDLNVSVALAGDLADTHLTGDNAKVLPTDTQKNTVYAFAREHGVASPEAFGVLLARHFVDSQPSLDKARVSIDSYGWERLGPHSFARTGGGVRTAVVTASGSDVWVVSGVRDLVLLNTTDSEFHGFIRDRYTTLAETSDRILATAVEASWRHSGEAAD